MSQSSTDTQHGLAGTPNGLSGIVGGLATDVQDLVRGEIKLARAELDEKFSRVVAAAIWLLGGALVAFAGLVVLLQGFAAALALDLPTWAAAIIVGVIFLIIGGVLSMSGISMLSLNKMTPHRTVANLEQDAQTVKEHI